MTTKARTLAAPGGLSSAASDARLLAIFRTTGVPMLLLDAERRIVDANQAIARIFGYSYTELRGRALDELTHPADRQHDVRLHRELFQGLHESVELEHRFRHKDGRVIWGHLTTSAIPGLDMGAPVELALGVFVDVTLRRHAEELYRAFFNSTNDGIAMCEPNTRRILECNPAFCRMFGYERSELLEMHTTDLVHPDSLETYAQLATAERVRVVLKGRCRDGSPIDVELNARNFDLYGTPTRLVVVRDIGDEVRAMGQLEERVGERTRALSALLDVARALSSTLELQPLLDAVLDSVRTFVDYTEAMITLLEGDDLCVAAYRGASDASGGVGFRLPASRAFVFQHVLRENGPVIIDDVLGSSPLADAYRAANTPALDTRPPAIRSVLGVPLRVKDRIVGQLRLDHAEPGFYTSAHAELAAAIANQAAVVIDNARLFEDGQRRRHELEALYQAEEALHRSLRPHAVLQALLDAAIDVLTADKAAVLLWDSARVRLNVQAARGFQLESLREMSYLPGEAIGPLAAQLGEIVDAEDAQHDPRIAPRVQALHAREGVQSLISVPIRVGGDVFGVFNVYSARERKFTSDDRRLLLSLAQRAAVALENARLFERERLARERLEVAVAAGRMGTWEWDIQSNAVTWSTQLEAIHGLAPGTFGGTFEAYLADIHPEDRDRVQQTITASMSGLDHALEYRIVWPDQSIHWLEASGRLIRDADGKPVGMRGVCRDVTARKEREVERARLVEREKTATQARAALEERQRLARELHDSVSQALYGIALGTQTTLAALREDRDLRAGEQASQYVLNLAEAAIAEMRALIFELRPETLQQEGLVGALERHAASLRARHALEVDAQFDREPDVPLDTKEALYRIAQEALQNAVRHARPRLIRLRLDEASAHVQLEIADDGIGFDPTRPHPGHLGLTSMRERAAAVGGELTIDSAPGQGTRVVVRVPLASATRTETYTGSPALAATEPPDWGTVPRGVLGSERWADS